MNRTIDKTEKSDKISITLFNAKLCFFILKLYNQYTYVIYAVRGTVPFFSLRIFC